MCIYFVLNCRKCILVSLIRISKEMAHLHKTACAKIPDDLLLRHKLLILCLFKCRHSQVSKTVFILKFGPPVAKKIKFEV